MLKYVRFLPKEATKPTAARFGVLKSFHFSAKSDEQILPLHTSPFEGGPHAPDPDANPIPLSSVRLVTPVTPGKIIGIGLNYVDHAKEQGKPIPEVPRVFLKAVSALSNPGDPIRLNKHCTEVHFEGELAVVIGKTCKNVAEAQALDFVAGYTVSNDVTDRPIQKAEPTFARAKGMDTFCPIGPFMVSGIDWKNRKIRTWVNGELKQDGNTSDMIHPVPKLISFISEFMTLLPGDVILTGTPAGVGQIKAGDRVKIEIEGIGALENAVE